MISYSSTTDFEKLATRLEGSSRILLLTHAKPDGDAIGSVLALHRALTIRGRACDIFLRGPVGWNLQPFIAAGEAIHLLEESAPWADYDFVVIADTGARSQLDSLGDWLAARRDRVAVIDHHVQGNSELADHRIIDTAAPSATFLVAGLIDALGVEIGGGPFSIAEALLLGLATDTGWFKHNNASPAAFRLAARLIEAGADKARIFAISEENDRPQRLALTARAIQSIEYIADGRAAVMTLLPEDFQITGADAEEMTGIVNEPLSIAAVRVAALLSAVDGTVAKISLRSKPAQQTPRGIIRAIDVNVIAGHFSGGGHLHAAGARVERPLAEVRGEVVALLEAALQREKTLAEMPEFDDPKNSPDDPEST